jgi:hypothetical protein
MNRQHGHNYASMGGLTLLNLVVDFHPSSSPLDRDNHSILVDVDGSHRSEVDSDTICDIVTAIVGCIAPTATWPSLATETPTEAIECDFGWFWCPDCNMTLPADGKIDVWGVDQCLDYGRDFLA